MGCACGGSSARSSAGAQNQAGQSGGGSAWVWEVTYANGGGTQQFNTEQEAITALSFGGGGYRQVRR